jgi:dipeptide/tripeptide permease
MKIPSIVPNIILFSVVTIIISTVISKIINQPDFAIGVGGVLLGIGCSGLLWWFFNQDFLLLVTSVYMILSGIIYIVDYYDRKNKISSSNMRAYTICFVLFFSAIFYVVLELMSEKTNTILMWISAAVGLTMFILGAFYASEGV